MAADFKKLIGFVCGQPQGHNVFFAVKTNYVLKTAFIIINVGSFLYNQIGQAFKQN